MVVVGRFVAMVQPRAKGDLANTVDFREARRSLTINLVCTFICDHRELLFIPPNYELSGFESVCNF